MEITLSREEQEQIRRGVANALVILQSLSAVDPKSQVVQDLRETLKLLRPRTLLQQFSSR